MAPRPRPREHRITDRIQPADEASRLGAELRARRHALHLTQEELAELAETTQRFVSTVETGKQTVRLDKVIEVADVLGLRVTFAERAGAPPTTAGDATTW